MGSLFDFINSVAMCYVRRSLFDIINYASDLKLFHSCSLKGGKRTIF